MLTPLLSTSYVPVTGFKQTSFLLTWSSQSINMLGRPLKWKDILWVALLLLCIEWKEVTFVMRSEWQEGISHGKTGSKPVWAEEMLPNVKLSTENITWLPPPLNPATLLSLQGVHPTLVSTLPTNHLSSSRPQTSTFGSVLPNLERSQLFSV